MTRPQLDNLKTLYMHRSDFALLLEEVERSWTQIGVLQRSNTELVERVRALNAQCDKYDAFLTGAVNNG